MTTDRIEAAAKALHKSFVDPSGEDHSEHWETYRDVYREHATATLGAAEAHDRVNSIARIRLDEKLVEKIARTLHDTLGCCSPSDACPFGPLTTDQARAVLDLLRDEAPQLSGAPQQAPSAREGVSRSAGAGIGVS